MGDNKGKWKVRTMLHDVAKHTDTKHVNKNIPVVRLPYDNTQKTISAVNCCQQS